VIKSVRADDDLDWADSPMGWASRDGCRLIAVRPECLAFSWTI
jgi:hypothetical protein